MEGSQRLLLVGCVVLGVFSDLRERSSVERTDVGFNPVMGSACHGLNTCVPQPSFHTITSSLGLSAGLQWTRSVLHCPDRMAVIEEAFYSSPSPEVCDAKCRMGPKALGEDECYHRDGQCVQSARQEEVTRLYESCRPTAAPTWCNFSSDDLPASLNVGYSCLQGTIFDPYNQTFSWKAKKVTLAFKADVSTPRTLLSRCKVRSDTTTPNVKITALKSPSTAQHDVSNVTSHANDIAVMVDDARVSIAESRFPHWWIMKEPRFEIEFKMTVTGTDLHPSWISLEDDHMIEIVCRQLDASSFRVTSPRPSIHNTAYSSSSQVFSVGDMVLAVVGTAGAVLALALILCLGVRWRRNRRRRSQDYSNLIARVEFHNQGADSCVAAFTPCNDVNATGSSFRGPCPLPSSACPEADDGGGGWSSSSFPKGAAVANDTYGLCSSTEDLQRPSKQTTFGCGADDGNKYETPLSLVVRLPDGHGQSCRGEGDGGACGGVGGLRGVAGEGWGWSEARGVYENTLYDEIPALPPATDREMVHTLG